MFFLFLRKIYQLNTAQVLQITLNHVAMKVLSFCRCYLVAMGLELCRDANRA